MLKFFRRLRYAFLKSNQTRNYLLYAFGEIVLVVLGILIALQINNWNEDQQLQAKTQNYYRQLLADLRKDRQFAQHTIAKFQKQRDAYTEYINEFGTSQFTLKTMYSSILKLNMESFALNFNTNTIESLKNSGEIVLISPTLRNKLLDLRRRQEKISQDESLDNRGKTGIAERLSMLIGTFNLEKRLTNQEEIKDALSIDKNLGNIILGLEAIQDWMNFSENKSIRLLQDMNIEIIELERLIENELKE